MAMGALAFPLWRMGNVDIPPKKLLDQVYELTWRLLSRKERFTRHRIVSDEVDSAPSHKT
jgi:hypothetical protein